MQTIIEKILTLSRLDLTDYLDDVNQFLTEDERADCFETLMEMVSELILSGDSEDAALAEKAEFAASLLVPYDDHSLRGRIRFNKLENEYGHLDLI